VAFSFNVSTLNQGGRYTSIANSAVSLSAGEVPFSGTKTYQLHFNDSAQGYRAPDEISPRTSME